MNTYKKRAVTQIIADSGPLISLATVDRLDLLQSFNRPVLITDVVIEECQRKRGAPGEERLSAWFQGLGENQFQKIRTPFVTIFEAAVQKEDAGIDPEATKGMGDATIAWLVANLERFRTRDDIALILTQDAPFGDLVMGSKRDAHVLGFRAWLGFLEAEGIIPSAKQMILDIQASGRHVSRYAADRPAIIDEGTRSDWKSATSDSDDFDPM